MENKCNITEFVGVNPIGDTIGLVIANVDQQVLDAMKLEKSYRSIGVVGARTGAGPHIMAADEAVKATNTEIVKIELPRDTKGSNILRVLAMLARLPLVLNTAVLLA